MNINIQVDKSLFATANSGANAGGVQGSTGNSGAPTNQLEA